MEAMADVAAEPATTPSVASGNCCSGDAKTDDATKTAAHGNQRRLTERFIRRMIAKIPHPGVTSGAEKKRTGPEGPALATHSRTKRETRYLESAAVTSARTARRAFGTRLAFGFSTGSSLEAFLSYSS